MLMLSPNGPVEIDVVLEGVSARRSLSLYEQALRLHTIFWGFRPRLPFGRLINKFYPKAGRSSNQTLRNLRLCFRETVFVLKKQDNKL